MPDISLLGTEQLEIHGEKVGVEFQCEGIAGVALTRGDAISIASATGLWQKADSDVETIKEQVYVASRTVPANAPLTGFKRVRVSGFDVSGLNYGAKIYLSHTAGKWSSTVPSGGNTLVCGIVEPLFGNGATPDKVIAFNLG